MNRADEFYALTYDQVVPDWPGEIDFYRQLAATARAEGAQVLEIACGTGRVAIRLGKEGTVLTGLDYSEFMLARAREKSAGLPTVRWVHADMRSFDLDETFGLVIIPGHSFQSLNTLEDQVKSLACIRRHLRPGGRLVVHLDHQDAAWLGSLRGAFEAAGEFTHPKTGRRVHTFNAWAYERATQTATLITRWEEVDEAGYTLQVIERGPLRFHCIFRFEMAHLLARTGFEVEALYGDFLNHPLGEQSSEMVWVTR